MPLWLSQTTRMCRVPDYKILVTSYATDELANQGISLASCPNLWNPYLFCTPFLPYSYLWCLIHVSGNERVRKQPERDLQITTAPYKFIMVINMVYFYDDLLTCL